MLLRTWSWRCATVPRSPKADVAIASLADVAPHYEQTRAARLAAARAAARLLGQRWRDRDGRVPGAVPAAGVMGAAGAAVVQICYDFSILKDIQKEFVRSLTAL
jgi:hypothetical protein